MSKAYRLQNIFFAFGVLCTLTVYNGDSHHALSKAKARALEIDKKNSSAPSAVIGYAAEEIKRIFTREGVNEAVIKLGDMIINMGRTRRLGIRNPFSKENINFAYLDVREKSMVTLYQNELKDTVFSRRNNLASVTLIGNNAVQLCKLCRTVISYTLNHALALLKGTEFEAIIVTKDEQVFTTSGLSRENQIAA